MHEPASREGALGARSVRSGEGSKSLSGLGSAFEHPFSSRRRPDVHPVNLTTHQPAAPTHARRHVLCVACAP